MKGKNMKNMSLMIVVCGMALLGTGCSKVGGAAVKQIGKMMSKPGASQVVSKGIVVPAVNEVYRHSDWNRAKCSACDGYGRIWNSYYNGWQRCDACGGRGEIR